MDGLEYLRKYREKHLLTKDQYQTLGVLLDIDRLKHGDVLLTRNEGITSRFISAITASKYSHAALLSPLYTFTGDGEYVQRIKDTDALFLFESTGKGVEYNNLKQYVVRFVNGSEKKVIEIDRQYSAVDVFRHQRISQVDSKTLCSGFSVLVEQQHGKYYPDIKRIPFKVYGLERFYEHLVSSSFREKCVSGMFCSELVASYFRLCGLDVFEKCKAPSRITPGKLVRWNSHLKQVVDISVSIDDGVKDISRVSDHDLSSKMLSSMNQNMRNLREALAPVEELADLFDRIGDAALRRVK